MNNPALIVNCITSLTLNHCRTQLRPDSCYRLLNTYLISIQRHIPRSQILRIRGTFQEVNFYDSEAHSKKLILTICFTHSFFIYNKLFKLTSKWLLPEYFKYNGCQQPLISSNMHLDNTLLRPNDTTNNLLSFFIKIL